MSEPMHVDVEVLRKLHRIHRQLTDLRDRLDRAPRKAAAREANAKRQEQELTRVRDEAKALRVTIENKSSQLKGSEAKLAELRVKLNQSKSNAEFQALKDEIAAKEAAKSVLEDEILETMERHEAYHGTVAEAEAALQKARDDAARVRTDLQEQQPRMRGDIERLEKELAEAESRLPDGLRDGYQRVVRVRGEDALAPVVEGQFCGSCNHQLRLNTINDLILQRPHFCDNCGTLLYVAEGETLVPHRSID